MIDSLRDLAAQLNRFAQERDWSQFHSPKNLASALVVEAGELLEHFQWATEAESRALSEEKLAEVGAEIADVLLYLVQLSSALGIDPIAAANAKIEVNALKYPVSLSRGSSMKSTERIRPIDPDLVKRVQALVEGVEVDLDAPLSPDDE